MAISLVKNQNISLDKGLSKVSVGLSWSSKSQSGFFASLFGGGEIDLDASILMLNENKKPIDTVWFRQTKSVDGSIVHSGDDRVGGSGKGDNEVISIDLKAVPEEVKYLVVTVNSYTNQKFSDIKVAKINLYDNSNGGKETIATFELNVNGGNHTGVYIASFIRKDNSWAYKIYEEYCDGQHVHKIADGASRLDFSTTN